MTLDRRKFLAAFAGIGGSILVGVRDSVAWALQVTARATVFFGQPDGRTTLVRFTVDGSSAPAGRLRVFDRARKLIGTAGVIGFGGRLHGELWMALDRATEIGTELETPGTRGVLRTSHRITPARRWTIYWTTIGDNAIRSTADPELLDHLDFLQLVSTPPDSAFAIDETGLLQRVATAPLLLAGSGLRLIGERNPAGPMQRLESRDGSQVIAVALAPGASPRELGIAAGRGEMERRVEQWLEGPGGQLADSANAVALIAGTNPEDAGIIEERVAEWNSRFAYPRIITGKPDPLLAILERRTPPGAPRRATPRGDRWQRPATDPAVRPARVFEPLITRLDSPGSGLAALANQFAFRVPGTLVANATPFTATGIGVMPDGTERIVTDVPALGYVCIPYPGLADDPAPRARGPSWSAVPGGDNDLTLDGRHFEIRIDLETGAVRSLVTRANGREWARRGTGLNTAGGFRLDTLQKLRNPSVGTRLIVTRRSTDAVLTSTLTIYDDMPWLDITNEVPPAQEPVQYGFASTLERPGASWEVPAGFDESRGAVERLVHLRWLKLAAGSDTLFLRGLDAPVASITAEGEIVSTAPARSRYRLGFASGYSAPEDPWRFGWGAEPFVTAAVPGTGRAALPSFGSLLVTDQPGVCIVDLRRDGGSNDVIVYLQELAGAGRDITVGPGVLSFTGARRIDFTGRDMGELPVLTGGGTAVPVRGYGITAVRLGGVELARA